MEPTNGVDNGSTMFNTVREDARSVAFCLDGLTRGDVEPAPDASAISVATPGDATQRMHVELTSNKWHGIKQTLEVIRNSYRTCIITADPKRFQVMAYDNKGQSPGFLLEIATSNLEPYTCASPISISLSTVQIATMLRHVRKRETVMFFIDSQNNRCGLLSNSTTGHARKSEINVSVVQLVYFEEPPCFADVRPFVVATADFGRMLKVLGLVYNFRPSGNGGVSPPRCIETRCKKKRPKNTSRCLNRNRWTGPPRPRACPAPCFRGID